MTPKSITLHRAASDNLGLFVDSGNDLVVGDQAEAGVITADRAREILASHGATGHYAKAAPSKPKTASKKLASPKIKPRTLGPGEMLAEGSGGPVGERVDAADLKPAD